MTINILYINDLGYYKILDIAFTYHFKDKDITITDKIAITSYNDFREEIKTRFFENINIRLYFTLNTLNNKYKKITTKELKEILNQRSFNY